MDIVELQKEEEEKNGHKTKKRAHTIAVATRIQYCCRYCQLPSAN